MESVHASSLELSTTLTSYFVKNFIKPTILVNSLQKAKIRSVLVGTHGFVGWMREPRACQDVELIVGECRRQRAVATLLAAHSRLVAEEDNPETLLYRGKANCRVIILSTDRSLFVEAFAGAELAHAKKARYRIPRLEMAIALSFAEMTSRETDQAMQYQRAHDFMLMVANNPNLHQATLRRFGELIRPGGGDGVLELLRRVRVSEKLNFWDQIPCPT